jgi:hypothetical protein
LGKSIKNLKKSKMETFGKIVGGILMMIIGIIIGGFILMKTWAWFIVPVFPTLPVLTLPQAIGISVFYAILTAKRIDDDKDFDDISEEWVKGLIYAVLLFLVAWIVFLCIR